MSRIRGTRWCFTINNFTQEEEELVMNMPSTGWVKSMIAEEEHLFEGTPHIQGYFTTNKKAEFTTLIKFFNGRAHLEQAKGSTRDNWNYCSKEGNVIVEFNRPSTVDRVPHRAREDPKDEWADLMIQDCEQMDRETFRSEHPDFFLNQRDKYERIHNEYMERTTTVFDGRLHDKNLWIYGPPGSGKTSLARSDTPPAHVYFKPFDKWWDGFDPSTHNRIVIDDYPNQENGGSILTRHMKIWGDRNVEPRQVKGGSIIVDPSLPVIVTSNFPIDECFSNDPDREAIHRRFQEIHLTNDKSKLDRYMHLNKLMNSEDPSDYDDSIISD